MDSRSKVQVPFDFLHFDHVPRLLQGRDRTDLIGQVVVGQRIGNQDKGFACPAVLVGDLQEFQDIVGGEFSSENRLTIRWLFLNLG